MAEPAKPVAGADVATPNSTPADATSKPLIQGHTSQVAADPMVNVATPPAAEEKPSAEPAQPVAAAPPSSTKPRIVPSAGAQEAQAAADKADDAAKVADDATEKTEEDNQTRVQELIESGEYNVSISQNNKKSGAGTFLVTVGAILLAGIIILFVLTDLKIIDLGIDLPFHIFKQ